MTLQTGIPLLVALITAIAGMITYLVQKRADRRGDLVRLRQTAYRDYLEAFQKHVNDHTLDSLGQYHMAALNLFVIASDPVLLAMGNFQKYMAETSPGKSRRRDMAKVGELLAMVLKAMRADCFERSFLSIDQVRNLLPIEGMNVEKPGLAPHLSCLVGSKVMSEYPAETEMTNVDEGDAYLEHFLGGLKHDLIGNYHELLRIGNPPNVNTAQIAVIAYMAKSISNLSPEQIERLRRDRILTI